MSIKLDILNRAGRGEKQVDIARMYGLYSSTVATIVTKQKDLLMNHMKSRTLTTPIITCKRGTIMRRDWPYSKSKRRMMGGF